MEHNIYPMYPCPLIETCTRKRDDSGFKLFCIPVIVQGFKACSTYRELAGIEEDDREMLPKEWLKEILE